MNPIKKTEYQIARQVSQLANKIVKRRNEHLKELAITGEQSDTLTFFYWHPNQSISDLKDYLQVTHQTARGIVSRMVEKNILQLTPSLKDGRVKVVTVTAKGQGIMQHLKHNGKNTGSQLLAGMTPTEQEQFSTLISRATQNIK